MVLTFSGKPDRAEHSGLASRERWRVEESFADSPVRSCSRRALARQILLFLSVVGGFATPLAVLPGPVIRAFTASSLFLLQFGVH